MVNAKRGELPIPSLAVDDDKAFELVRIWTAGGQQNYTLAAGVWKDPAAWGLLLADLARHAANAMASEMGENTEAVLARIKEAFDAEWSFPTG